MNGGNELNGKLGLGVVGLGEGISLIRGSVESEHWELRTVCDLDESLARSVAGEYSVAWTRSLAEVCADDQIDCVAIYTPDGSHAEHLSMVRQRRDVEAGLPMPARSVEARDNGDERGGTSGRWGKTGGDDWVFTGLSHPDSDPMIVCTVRATLSAHYPDLRYLTQVDGQGLVAYYDPDQHARYFPFGGAAHHVGEFANYLEAMGEALRSGAEPRPNREDGLQVVATLLVIQQSIETGAEVSVPELLQRAGVSLG